MMTSNEKLEAIRKHAERIPASGDEYAVGLAAEVLAVIDGTVTAEQIMQHCSGYGGTVGKALAEAKGAKPQSAVDRFREIIEWRAPKPTVIRHFLSPGNPAQVHDAGRFTFEEGGSDRD